VLNINRNEFNRLLDIKLTYKDTIEEKLNADYLINEFNNKLELIKDEIDLRIES
jgi:hypothetical protein